MEIDVRAQHTWVADTFRYQITVNKGGGYAAKYYLDIKKITQEMHHWFVHIYVDSEILDSAYMLEFYDIEALNFTVGQKRSAFDTYTTMNYTFRERELLFVRGVGEAIINFVARSQARLVFSAPLRPALAKIHDSLLKKHARRVQYLYKMEFIKDGLYVIEIQRIRTTAGTGFNRSEH
ncbi:hypothetical protein [Serratia plymuthica]|uniref:hypothetical protein n=1 Tax=Serratia plymuthica TaxID=82996 RepID=UPI0018D808ED|nr:hypothetical protein [Serratia plymuthica]QPS54604.1 hypothetical protein I6G53_18260 [Serratia plymuthica]CAI1639514.1 Uncharacterised protein [Serratia plymuthica]